MYLLLVQARNIKMTDIKYVINNMAYGNFFVLYNIGKNINPFSFQELVLCIRIHLEKSKHFKVVDAEV